jgi:hypothetical protein
MTAILDEFTATLHEKAKGAIKGTAKLVIGDHGTVMLTEEGASAGDHGGDVRQAESGWQPDARPEGQRNSDQLAGLRRS